MVGKANYKGGRKVHNLRIVRKLLVSE